MPHLACGLPMLHDDMCDVSYGPFWIATTLFISMAVTGNVASYIEHDGPTAWQYDFSKVTLAATLFYCCISILPIFIWFALKRADQQQGLVQVISIHGYALTPYIPAAVTTMGMSFHALMSSMSHVYECWNAPVVSCQPCHLM